jgi:uncharacterized protein GlcG (DUF336 family)
LNRSRRAGAIVAATAAALTAAACVQTRSERNLGSSPTSGVALAASDVDSILARAVSAAQSSGLPAAIAVCDRDGEVLGVFVTAPRDVNGDGRIETVTEANIQSAISKASTAGFFQSAGEAFTTRTAFFIVQGHFPPNVVNTPAGPLFGVQDSSVAATDGKPAAFDASGNAQGSGISGEYGGVPLYIQGTGVGGIGVETADVLVTDNQGALTLASFIQNNEDEAIARAGSSGFDAPFAIQATNVFVNGISFPFFGPELPLTGTASTLASLPAGTGALDPRFPVRASPLAAEVTIGTQTGIRPTHRYPGRVASRSQTTFVGTFTNVDRPAGVAIDPTTLAFTNVPVVTLPTTTHAGVLGEERFPTIDGVEPPPSEGGLTAADVNQAIDGAVSNAASSVAGIREPRGVNVVVHVAIVDRRGNILGVFRMGDGTLFSFDIAIQKARTCAFFSTDGSEGLPPLAVSARGIGFLAQPFYPPGIDSAAPGPLVGVRQLVNRGEIPVEPTPDLTVVFPPPRAPSDGTTDEDLLDPGFQRFNDYSGPAPAELAAVRGLVGNRGGFPLLADRPDTTPAFVSPGLQNGLQTFPGGVPLYKNGKLVGAIGVSGDGVDQDDDAAEMGSVPFSPPPGTRLDEADNGTIATVLQAKVSTIVAAISAHPDPRVRLVYTPVAQQVQARVTGGFARGLQGLTIPYTKLPRNPGTR